MPINTHADADIAAVLRIHGALTDFKKFLQSIRDDIDGDVSALTQVPSRVTTLLAQKANFDALGLSGARIEEIMTKNMGYDDWPTQVADFNAVFAEAPGLRTAVINNAAALTQSYDGNAYQLAATGGVRTGLAAALDGILEHYT